MGPPPVRCAHYSLPGHKPPDLALTRKGCDHDDSLRAGAGEDPGVARLTALRETAAEPALAGRFRKPANLMTRRRRFPVLQEVLQSYAQQPADQIDHGKAITGGPFPA